MSISKTNLEIVDENNEKENPTIYEIENFSDNQGNKSMRKSKKIISIVLELIQIILIIAFIILLSLIILNQRKTEKIIKERISIIKQKEEKLINIALQNEKNKVDENIKNIIQKTENIKINFEMLKKTSFKSDSLIKKYLNRTGI